MGEACLRMEARLSFEWGIWSERGQAGWEVWVERGSNLSGDAQD